MNATITVDLPEDVKDTLGEAAREEGVSESVLAGRALRDYLFLRRFKRLADKLASETNRPYTDEEVFERVS